MPLTATERQKTQVIAGNLMGCKQAEAQHVLDHDADAAECRVCAKWRGRPDMLQARAWDEAKQLAAVVTETSVPVQPPSRLRL